jgi:DNA-binding helix-hairpin-helix protein with protein kinase domain
LQAQNSSALQRMLYIAIDDHQRQVPHHCLTLYAGREVAHGCSRLLTELWRVVRAQTPSLAHAGALAELRPAPIPVGARCTCA